MTVPNSIKIDGQEYRPVGPTGNRCVVVIDRGWIYAGDVTRKDGRIRIDNAVWVCRWESIGFDGVLKDPLSKQVTLKSVPYPVDLPEDAELFCVPVPDGWGVTNG